MPTILFNNVEGSDSQASGSGPLPAKFGSMARGSQVGSTAIGFLDAGLNNLNSVNSGHVLWLGTTSGRKFTKVLNVKNNRRTVNGTAVSGNTTLTVSSSVGMIDAIAKPFVLIVGGGAGGTDLYTTIESVISSTSIRLTTAPSSSGAVTVIVPYQVEVEDSVTLAADTPWAVGGKRRTMVHADSDDLFFSDAKPGWIIQIENTGLAYQFGLTINTAGDANDAIILQGPPGATSPEITSSGSAIPVTFGTNANRWLVTDLKLTRTGTANGPTMSITGSSTFGFVFRRLDISNSTTGGSASVGFVYTGTSKFPRLLFEGCAIHDCYAGGYTIGNVGSPQSWGLTFIGCSFARNGKRIGGKAAVQIFRVRGMVMWECLSFDNYGTVDPQFEDCGYHVITSSVMDANCMAYSVESAASNFWTVNNIFPPAIRYLAQLSHVGAFVANCAIVRHTVALAINPNPQIAEYNVLAYSHDYFIGYNATSTPQTDQDEETLGTWYWRNFINGAYEVGTVWDNEEDLPDGGTIDDGYPFIADMERYEPGFVDALTGRMDYSLGSEACAARGYTRNRIGGGPYNEAVASQTLSMLDIGPSQLLALPPLIHFRRKAT